jgi:hypothetical protein
MKRKRKYTRRTPAAVAVEPPEISKNRFREAMEVIIDVLEQSRDGHGAESVRFNMEINTDNDLSSPVLFRVDFRDDPESHFEGIPFEDLVRDLATPQHMRYRKFTIYPSGLIGAVATGARS